MSTLQISYDGYLFHEQGVPQYGHGMQVAGAAGVPRKYTESFRIKLRFFETSFADNEARWNILKTKLRQTPRGQLVITDERGQAIENRQVRFAGIEGGEEWGQYRREVTVSFEAIGGVLLVSDQCASFTPTGQTQIVLPNVETMNGGIKTDRPTSHAAIRREQTETVNLSGKWTANPELTTAQRRDALLAKKAEIEGIKNAPDGVLTYGSFSKTMQIESVNCDLGDATDELTWTLSAFLRRFPTGVYAELEYEADFSEDVEDGTRTVSVTGKVVADTKDHATSAALDVKAEFAGSRQFLSQSLRYRIIKGTDGTDDCVELNFTFRFKEAFGATTSYKLTVTTAYDARAGEVTVTYAGSVTATNAATALAKARDLGSGKEGGTMYLMNSSEQVATHGVGAVDISVSVDFTYAYLGKSAIKFAEVSYDTGTEFFGANTFTISGSVTASTEAAALTYARSFKVAGLLERSIKETPSKIQKDTHAYDLFNKVEFSYTYAKAAIRNTVSYGKEVSHDFDARETTVSFSGTCYGGSEAACNATIDSVVTESTAGARKVRSVRTPNFDHDASNGLTVLNSVSFNDTWRLPLQASDSATIIDAQYSIARSFGVWKAVIDEIPGGNPFVQENVTKTCGTITVSGSVTAAASAESAARTWARDKKTFATGHIDQAEETPSYTYLPGGSTVKMIQFGFTYASRDPNLFLNF